MEKIHQVIVAILAAVFVGSLTACQTTPVADIKPGEKPAKESDVGGLWFQMDKFEKRVQNAPNRVRDKQLISYISELTCEITQEYCKDVRVYVMDVPDFNAFMAPNGMMVVWTGLLLRAQNEEQLAFVLAHELGHFVKQHSVQQFRKQKSYSNVLSVLSFGVPYAGSLGALAAIGAIQKHSRDHEREADSFAVTQLARLNINPKAGADIFALVLQEAEASGNPRPGIFFASHPASEERVANISNISDVANTNQESNPANSNADYLGAIRKHYPAWLKKEVAKRSYATSEVLLKRLATNSADPGLVNYYLGELYRKRGTQDDLKEAVNYYKQHLEQDTSLTNAYKSLGDVYKKLGQKKDAVSAYEQYLSSGDNSGKLQDRKAILQQINNLNAS